MSNGLGRWGRRVYSLRWWLFGLSVLSLAPAVIILAQGARLEAGTVLTTTQSGRGADLMARQLPGQPVSFDLIFSSATLRATDRAFRIGQTRHFGVRATQIIAPKSISAWLKSKNRLRGTRTSDTAQRCFFIACALAMSSEAGAAFIAAFDAKVKQAQAALDMLRKKLV